MVGRPLAAISPAGGSWRLPTWALPPVDSPLDSHPQRPGLPSRALADALATAGVRPAVALTATTLGPSLGESRDLIPAQILAGGQGGGLDVGVIAGSLEALRGDAIALGRHRAAAAHAHLGERVAVMLGDGTRTHATVVAIYTRELAFGDAFLGPRIRRRPPNDAAPWHHPGQGRQPSRRRRPTAIIATALSRAAGE